MPITTAEEADNLIKCLHTMAQELERSQASVNNRINDIRQGNLHPQRTTTRELMAQRDRAKHNLKSFLEHLSEEENTTLAIAWGNRNWRDQYNAILDRHNTPTP